MVGNSDREEFEKYLKNKAHKPVSLTHEQKLEVTREMIEEELHDRELNRAQYLKDGESDKEGSLVVQKMEMDNLTSEKLEHEILDLKEALQIILSHLEALADHRITSSDANITRDMKLGDLVLALELYGFKISREMQNVVNILSRNKIDFKTTVEDWPKAIRQKIDEYKETSRRLRDNKS